MTEIVTNIRKLQVCRRELRKALEQRNTLSVVKLGQEQEHIIRELDRSATGALIQFHRHTPAFTGERPVFYNGAAVPVGERGPA